jgi:hypothetical protein
MPRGRCLTIDIDRVIDVGRATADVDVAAVRNVRRVVFRGDPWNSHRRSPDETGM